MNEIITYVLSAKSINPKFINIFKTFNLSYEFCRDTDEYTKRKLYSYIRANKEFFKSINSLFILLYVYNYVLLYKLPNLQALQSVYGKELVRYILIEDIILNTPIDYRRENLYKESIINASLLGLHLSKEVPIVRTTKSYVNSILNLSESDISKTLLMWEEQGICITSGGLITLITDIYTTLAQPPHLMVNYLLKWNRNERLKGLKLI